MRDRAEDPDCDLLVVGAGAAGLMAAIRAARTAPNWRVVVVDGARTLGAKILVSGGGRCNVTHERVDPRDFAGSTPAAIRKVLARWSVADTTAFFAERGVALKREETGKLFPTTDRARSVLDALLEAAREVGVALLFPARVAAIRRDERGFAIDYAAAPARAAPTRAARVVLATGGLALPKSGSDGAGHAIARALGHTITPAVLPALVPLRLAEGHPLRGISGVAAPAALTLRAGSGKRGLRCTGPVLCTHFGLSGPAVLDVSRHLLAAREADPEAGLLLSWLPERSEEEIDAALRGLGAATLRAWIRPLLPERLGEAVLAIAGADPATRGGALDRPTRRAVIAALLACDLPVVGDRGFAKAETTAGGVPLAEIDLATMASRRCPGLFLCGELCDVDGRLGGFNFQWAWASGHVAGLGAAQESSSG